MRGLLFVTGMHKDRFTRGFVPPRLKLPDSADGAVAATVNYAVIHTWKTTQAE